MVPSKPSPSPEQRPRGASEIKHPSFAATRKHFAANPLPGQQDRRAS